MGWVLEPIETKQKRTKTWQTSLQEGEITFRRPHKFTQQEVMRIYLNNFRHGLSITLMPQTFQGLNDLYTKVHDIGIHLNKSKESVKENNGKIGCLLTAAAVPRERVQYNVSSSSSEKPYPEKPEIVRKAAQQQLAAVVSYQMYPHRGRKINVLPRETVVKKVLLPTRKK